MARENECGLFQTRNWITRRPAVSKPTPPRKLNWRTGQKTGRQPKNTLGQPSVIDSSSNSLIRLNPNGPHMHDNGTWGRWTYMMVWTQCLYAIICTMFPSNMHYSQHVNRIWTNSVREYSYTCLRIASEWIPLCSHAGIAWFCIEHLANWIRHIRG